jgi:hypothetical protein
MLDVSNKDKKGIENLGDVIEQAENSGACLHTHLSLSISEMKFICTFKLQRKNGLVGS